MRRWQENKKKLNAQDLTALREKLAAMSQSDLDIFYKATHNACSYRVRLPSPIMIQELVQVWKELYRRRTFGSRL